MSIFLVSNSAVNLSFISFLLPTTEISGFLIECAARLRCRAAIESCAQTFGFVISGGRGSSAYLRCIPTRPNINQERSKRWGALTIHVFLTNSRNFNIYNAIFVINRPRKSSDARHADAGIKDRKKGQLGKQKKSRCDVIIDSRVGGDGKLDQRVLERDKEKDTYSMSTKRNGDR